MIDAFGKTLRINYVGFAYVFFYGPIAVILFVGTFLMGRILYEIFKVKMMAKGKTSGTSMLMDKETRDHLMEIFRTPMLFLLGFHMCWLLGIGPLGS